MSFIQQFRKKTFELNFKYSHINSTSTDIKLHQELIFLRFYSLSFLGNLQFDINKRFPSIARHLMI
jgi:hypothetical protein